MKWFRRRNRPQGMPTEGSGSDYDVRKLLRLAESDEYETAERAIRSMEKMPFSDEIFQCLCRLTEPAITGSGPHSDTAISALGLMGHPRAASRLVEILASESGSCSKAAKAVGHDRNRSAVPELLDIALYHRNWVCVERAIDALHAMEVPESKSALAEFYSQAERELYVYRPFGDGPEPISSSTLGQVPTDYDMREAQAAVIAKNPFAFGPLDDLPAILRDCLRTPDQFQLMKLADFLREKRYSLGYHKDAPASKRHVSLLYMSKPGLHATPLPAFVAPWLEARLVEHDARKKEIDHFLSTQDTTKLKSYLFAQLKLQDDCQWAFVLLDSLPAIRSVAELVDLTGSQECPEQSRLCGLKLIAKHAPENLPHLVLSILKGAPDSSICVEALRLLQGSPEQAIALVLPFLQDDRWAARKRAVEFLAGIDLDSARAALASHLEVEKDNSIRVNIETALDQRPA